jgi:hypothetical protein
LIDKTRTLPSDIDQANVLLAPAIAKLQAQTNVTFDFWELMNWLFVSVYWTAFYDVGQISPTLTGRTEMPSTNNIFVNQTLFEYYTSYLRHTVLPFLGPKTDWEPDFDNLTNENCLKAIDVEFVRSYQCVEKRLKSPISLIVYLIAADYAMIGIPRAMVIWIAIWIQRRRQPDCTPIVWQSANMRELLRRMY